MQGCLCETTEVVPGVTSIDLDQFERSLARHFTAVHRLREALDLPEDLCEEVAEGIIGMFRISAVERIEGDEYQSRGQRMKSWTDPRTPSERRASRLIWIAVAGAAVTAILVVRYLQGAG